MAALSRTGGQKVGSGSWPETCLGLHPSPTCVPCSAARSSAPTPRGWEGNSDLLFSLLPVPTHQGCCLEPCISTTPLRHVPKCHHMKLAGRQLATPAPVHPATSTQPPGRHPRFPWRGVCCEITPQNRCCCDWVHFSPASPSGHPAFLCGFGSVAPTCQSLCHVLTL